jgi:hypothetical protein
MNPQASSLLRLPEAFCWSKFGAEAGEEADSILRRKELERQEAGGLFLWGIGNSLGPSIRALVASNPVPHVLFTPMIAPASAADRAPTAVVSWSSATGLDGSQFDIPAGASVTSRMSSRGKHFALVCRSRFSLLESPRDLWLSRGAVSNLLTGSPVGSSQVTAIVRLDPAAQSDERKYRVAIDARLEAPYLLVLDDPVLLGGSR